MRGSASTSNLRGQIETWFLRRGVPQLIDDYTSERRMDARAGPFVLVWLVGGSFLWWGTRPDWPLSLNLLGGVLLLASMGLGVTAIRKLRGQVMWWVDRRLEVLDTFSLGPLIAIPSAFVEQSWYLGITHGFNALLGMAVIYGVIGLGLGEIAWWSLRRLRQELGQIVGLLARTLPILLILVLFLLFAAELWEAAYLLSIMELYAVILLLGLVAALLVLTAFNSDVTAVQGDSWEHLRDLAASTPAEPLTHSLPSSPVPKLRVLQRINLAALVLIGQLIQSGFVAVVVAGFLVVFGFLVLPASLQEAWIGDAVTGLLSVDMLGESRVLSRELVTTSCLLGGVVGLYFTGLAVTDSSYRTAHFDRILEEVRQTLAARAFYAVKL